MGQNVYDNRLGLQFESAYMTIQRMLQCQFKNSVDIKWRNKIIRLQQINEFKLTLNV